MPVRGIALAAVSVPFLLLLGAFQPRHGAAQEITNEEEYSGVMRQIGLNIENAAMNIDATYWDELTDASARLTRLFERVQAFWTARQVPPAVDFAAAALAATDALRQAGGARSGSGASQALTELRGACRSCHGEYRERVGDGFRIKPGV